MARRAEITSGIIAAACRWRGASLSTPFRKVFTSSWAAGLSPPLNPAARWAAETALAALRMMGRHDGAALYPLVDDGLLLVVRLEDPNEEAYFVELAATLDDGEAIMGAIALNRGYSVAIDDRKARRVLGEKAPGMRLVSTLELVQHWATAVTSQEVILVLRAMQHGAHYIPGQRDPLYDWWRAIMEGSKTDDP